ncbi:MAG: hypothetical protein EA369_01205 [Bradymonadales bacterium]|nr:MAG: hypothetical protein EA369_01205 [Bradymonadales bacterium]
MQLNDAWHPFEIGRRLRLFWEESKVDMDLRFPETRRRLAIELRFNLPAGDRSRFIQVIERFQRAKRSISFLDWGLLIEWNERRRQAECLSQIVHSLSSHSEEVGLGSELERRLQNRLEEILQSIRQEPLRQNPSLFESIRFRWKFVALRDEALYLRDRLHHIESRRSA